MVLAPAGGVQAHHGVVDVQVHAGHALEHGDVDVLALAGDGLVVERRTDGAEGVLGGHHVADDDADFDRRAVGLAGEVHGTAAGLDHHVKAGLCIAGAELAVGRHRAVNDAGIQIPDGLVVQAVALHDARAEVLHHHVADFDELLENADALGVLHVDGDGLLSAVVGHVGHGLAVQPRGEGAGIIPLDGGFYLDHLCPAVGHSRCGDRAGCMRCEIQYSDAA